jgi:hypothetical protein
VTESHSRPTIDKGGHLPALPLFLHIEWRIRGLMLLLLIGLQVLTLLEW